MAEEVAVLAGGCFWCTEAVFLDVVGVTKVESGYTGGTVANPTYKQVCGGDTGHAEAIRITFDNEQLSYDDLLDIFFATHDPTQLNRQVLACRKTWRLSWVGSCVAKKMSSKSS